MSIPLDVARVAEFRRDYLILLSNLKRVTDYDSAMLLRGAFSTWSQNLESFIFRDFLGNLKKESRGNTVIPLTSAKYWEEKIRRSLWPLVIENPPIDSTDEYHSKEMNYERYLREVKAFEGRARRASREAWKTLNDFIEWYANSADGKTIEVDVPEEENISIAGFDVTFIGLNTIERDRGETFRDLEAAFKKYRERASRVLPVLLQKAIPFIVDYKNDEAFSTAGRYEGRHIRLIGWSVAAESLNEKVRVIAHEMGHHLQHMLSGQEQIFWADMINGDRGTLDLREVVKNYDPKDGWILHEDKIRESDPYLFYQLDGMRYSQGLPSELKNAADVKDLIEYLNAGGEPIIGVHAKPISGYANKNPEEAFCEAIGLLVAYGPQTVDEQVQSWLKEIVPSLRIASAKTFIFDAPVNRGLCMNRTAIASELVKLAKELMAGTGLGLEGVSNNKAKKFLNDLMAKHTKGVFRDNSWEPVNALFREFRNQNINYTIMSAEYKENEKGVPVAKEWRVEFDFTNNNGRDTKLYGMIRASGMGTLDDVLARYDIVSYVS